MARIPLLTLIAASLLALSSCGGGSDSPNDSGSAADAGAGTSSGATAPQPSNTGPSGATGKTKEHAQGKGTGTGGSSAGTTGSPSTTSGSGGAAAPAKSRQKGKPKLPPVDRAAAKRDLYNTHKAACRVLGLKRVATEYGAKSLRPRDVAKAYTQSYVKAKLPSYGRRSVFRGCLAGLTAK
jgi:hypothetical protein